MSEAKEKDLVLAQIKAFKQPHEIADLSKGQKRRQRRMGVCVNGYTRLNNSIPKQKIRLDIAPQATPQINALLQLKSLRFISQIY